MCMARAWRVHGMCVVHACMQVRTQLLDYSDFFFREMDWWIGTALYLCLLLLTLLPISYLHSKMLFNSAFADTLSQINNRRQLMGELYTLFTIRASSFYQLALVGLKRSITCLATRLCGHSSKEPPPAFDPSWSALPATLSHMGPLVVYHAARAGAPSFSPEASIVASPPRDPHRSRSVGGGGGGGGGGDGGSGGGDDAAASRALLRRLSMELPAKALQLSFAHNRTRRLSHGAVIARRLSQGSPVVDKGQSSRRKSSSGRNSCYGGDGPLSRLSSRHDASCEGRGLDATNSDTRELSSEPPWHDGGGARGSGGSTESGAMHTPRSIRERSGTPGSLDMAMARGRGQAGTMQSVGAVLGRAKYSPVALSEAADDEARSGGGGDDVSGGGDRGGGDQHHGWGVPRRSGPGVRRRDSLSMENQMAVAEAAAVVALEGGASETTAGPDMREMPDMPEMPLRSLTLPGPVAAQIQMHGLMLMQHWSSLTSMNSERTQSRMQTARSRESRPSRSLGGMARVADAAEMEPRGVSEVGGAVDRLTKIAAVRPPIHTGLSLEQVVASSARPFALPRDEAMSEDAGELYALVHFVNELLSRGEAGGSESLPLPTRSWVLPLQLVLPLSSTDTVESHRHSALSAECKERYLFRPLPSASALPLSCASLLSSLPSKPPSPSPPLLPPTPPFTPHLTSPQPQPLNSQRE